ncbi:MAG: helix-turn-helix domain-containing protein [Bacteroidetes bacterium]|nr:helix-turn-helix domain-containing protein [Bacteroidota bacterium]
MNHLTILVPDGQPNPITIISTYMAFMQAEKHLVMRGGKPVFEKIVLAGISEKVDVYGGLFSVTPIEDISNVKNTNLVVIPAFLPQTNTEQNIKQNKKIVQWIEDQYKNGAEVASLCTGAFILASTGLVDGKKCSIHWNDANAFRQMFPKVNLVADHVITHEHGLYTSGGAFSFMNLVLYLLEKYYGREMAILCSKLFQVDIDRSSQSPYIVFNGQKSHDDEIVLKAQEFLEKSSMDKFSVEKLAKELAVSRRNLDRRFFKATGNTPTEYLQRVKVESAKKQLEISRKTVQEIMYETGYSDLKAFREVFKKVTGLSPLEYRNKYNKEAVTASS